MTVLLVLFITSNNLLRFALDLPSVRQNIGTVTRFECHFEQNIDGNAAADRRNDSTSGRKERFGLCREGSDNARQSEKTRNHQAKG
jgi:hypothetical protein